MHMHVSIWVSGSQMGVPRAQKKASDTRNCTCVWL